MKLIKDILAPNTNMFTLCKLNLEPVQNTALNVLLLRFDRFGFPSAAQISPTIAADKIA